MGYRMHKLKAWKRRIAAWWGFPLLLGAVLIPLVSHFSPTFILDSNVTLLLLSIAMSLALLMLYDLAALPGIFIGLLVYYTSWLEFDSSLVMSIWYLFSLTVCWLGYRIQTSRRGSTSIGMRSINRYWVLWLVILLPLLLVLGSQILVDFELLPTTLGLLKGEGVSLRLLLNYQGVLLACLACVQPMYCLVRLLLQPTFGRIIQKKIGREIAHNTTCYEILLWLVFLLIMVVLLSYEYDDQNILLSNHTLSLLLLVMLYGAVRFGFIIVSTVWAGTILILLHHYPGMTNSPNEYLSLTFNLSLLLIFTITIILVSTISARQRITHEKARHLALIDPLTGLPNLRCLTRDLARHETSTLCFIRMDSLDILSRAYGIQLRIQFKQDLEQILKPLLGSHERLYQLPGYDLVVRFNSHKAEQILPKLRKRLDQFRMLWNGMPIHPHYGLGYCDVTSPVKHLNSLLGELSAVAEEALNLGMPQRADLNDEKLQLRIQAKVGLLQHIQQALDNGSFTLMVQPITGVRGDSYYQVSLRLRGDQGKWLLADDFSSVAHEFGLAYALDSWTLTQALQFMNQHRERLPSLCIAVNLSRGSICRPSLYKDIRLLLRRNQIEPYQLIFEVTDFHLLTDQSPALLNFTQLRHLGCRIVIDDFGSKYATYSRLKPFQADFLKIHGQFVTHLLGNPVDQYIVEAMCRIARLKNMEIVAECVDKEEQKTVLSRFGVTYIQGKLAGKAIHLNKL